MQLMDMKRAQKLMKEKGIDVLVANTGDNVYYSSGYFDKMADWLPVMAIVPADLSLAPGMVVNKYIEVQAKQRANIKDVRPYRIWMPIVEADEIVKGTVKIDKDKPVQFSLDHVFSFLSDILKERKLDKGVVGLEKNLIQSAEKYAILTKQNPKVKFVEADEIFWELRRVKSQDEIKLIRLAADIGVEGYQAMLKGGVLGATIGELHLRYKRGVMQAASAENAMDLEKIRLTVSAGDHFGTMENAGYRLSKGDVCFVDNGVTAFGYTSDIGRTFSVGKPPEATKKLFDALKEGYEAAASIVKPGVKMKEIHRVLHEVVEKKGYPWFARGHTGHSIGIGQTEQPPFIAKDQETVLEPNMVIAIECAVHPIGRFGGLQLEDMFLVTASGKEILTELPREMVEL
jgi:Xaa-Pro aminopeptidase